MTLLLHVKRRPARQFLPEPLVSLLRCSALMEEDYVTPQERRDMPWIVGAFFALGCLLCGVMMYRLF
jgi:hypothetical protein